MGDIHEGTPKFTPFVIHEVTMAERERYRDSPTHSILKTPTAIFSTGDADEINRSGKKLTFADSPNGSEKSDSTPKQTFRNGDGYETPIVEVAVSPTKSIRVSPEAWKAHLKYQRTFSDYPNETVKTDYTYSKLSPFHNREILPGLTMRPNMSRLPLRSAASAPTTRASTPVTSRRHTAAPFSSPFVKAVTHRIESWQRSLHLTKQKSFIHEKKQHKVFWWLLILFILFIGTWSIFGKNRKISEPKNVDGLPRRQVAELFDRLDKLERDVVEELRRKRNNQIHWRHYQRALQVQRSLTSSWWNCRQSRIAALYAQAKIKEDMEAVRKRQVLLEDEITSLALRFERKVRDVGQEWMTEVAKLKRALVTIEEHKTDHFSVNGIISEALKLYDADKTGLADFALESSGGRVISTRCTQPWPNSHGLSSDPRVAIRRGSTPGECWAFQGEGRLVIQLSYAINVTGCSIEHIPSSIHPQGRIFSAPKNFSLWGLLSEDDPAPHLFGEYFYDIKEDAETVQYFQVMMPSKSSFSLVELVLSSNHGNPYTCLYRVRVHGTYQN